MKVFKVKTLEEWLALLATIPFFYKKEVLDWYLLYYFK